MNSGKLLDISKREYWVDKGMMIEMQVKNSNKIISSNVSVVKRSNSELLYFI